MREPVPTLLAAPHVGGAIRECAYCCDGGCVNIWSRKENHQHASRPDYGYVRVKRPLHEPGVDLAYDCLTVPAHGYKRNLNFEYAWPNGKPQPSKPSFAQIWGLMGLGIRCVTGAELLSQCNSLHLTFTCCVKVLEIYQWCQEQGVSAIHGPI